MTGRIWYYVLRLDLSEAGARIEVLARFTTEEKAQAFRVHRRLAPSVALVRAAAVKIAPGVYTGKTFDEEAAVRTGALVRCFLAVDE
jgi:hypothetical protein